MWVNEEAESWSIQSDTLTEDRLKYSAPFFLQSRISYVRQQAKLYKVYSVYYTSISCE